MLIRTARVNRGAVRRARVVPAAGALLVAAIVGAVAS